MGYPGGARWMTPVAAGLLLLIGAGQAVAGDRPDPGWINYSMGYSSTHSSMHGFANTLAINGKTDDNHFWSLGIDGTSSSGQLFNDCAMTGLFNSSCGNGSDGYASAGSLRYGVIGQGALGFATMSLGPSYVQGRQEGSNESTNRELGLALESQIMWSMSRHFALGLVVFGNVNGSNSFAGAGLNLAITDL
ncbi:hypothetical protein [Dongshaea marina]|uniref:hypothetical protein n=1 Tax=Dongshaea marina TaxID=2047966 RepID=UPI000D3E9A9B|nr:hypothetical protein [Dongshaea marina]